MPATETSRWHWQDWAFVSAATVLAGILRFHALDRKSFWLDEGVSVVISRLDWYNFIRLMWRREANMSLYYLLLRGWQHLGGSEFFLRSLSVIFAVATVPAVYWLGLRLFNRRVAIVASLLFAVNAYNVRYAQEARSYALYVLLGTLSWIFFADYVGNPSPRNRRFYICCSALAVYAHLYFAFFIVAQWIALRVHGAKAPSSATAAFRWIAGLTFPAFLFAATTGVGPLRWVHRPSLKDVYAYYDHMAGNGGPWLLLACLAAIAIALWPHARTRMRRNADWDTWRYQLLLIWMMFPVGLILLLSLARPLFVPRYLIGCQPAFLVLVAAGVDRLSRTWLRAAVMIVLVSLSVHGTLAYYDHDFDLDRDDYRAASNYLLERARPGDVAVFEIAQTRMPYEFYRSIYSGKATAPRVIYPSLGDRLDYRDFMRKATADSIRAAIGQYDRVWLVLQSNEGAPDQDPMAKGPPEMFEGQEEKAFPGIIVRLYSRAKPAPSAQECSRK